jgi:AcrR family transcriptional regulator
LSERSISLNACRVIPVNEPKTRTAKRAATAQRILEAAQIEFGERGLEATTVRGIARRAGVDPSLVIQHYGSKNALFAIAAQLHRENTDTDVTEHLLDVLDIRLNEPPPETRALMRSMLTTPEATRWVKEFLDERVGNLAPAMDGDEAELRAALVVSSILGLTIARHFLKLDVLTAVTDEQIETTLRPWLTAALGHEIPSPRAGDPRTRDQPQTP